MSIKELTLIKCILYYKIIYLYEMHPMPGEGRGVKMLDVQTDRHTEPQTKRVLEEHSLLKIIAVAAIILNVAARKLSQIKLNLNIKVNKTITNCEG